MSVLCQFAPERAFAQAAAAPQTAASTTPPSEALQHYNRGRQHYQAGRYREALQELEVAVNLDPSSPNLVYNVARVYELLGEIDQAIAFYRRYRDMLPANERAERERTVLTCNAWRAPASRRRQRASDGHHRAKTGRRGRCLLVGGKHRRLGARRSRRERRARADYGARKPAVSARERRRRKRTQRASTARGSARLGQRYPAHRRGLARDHGDLLYTLRERTVSETARCPSPASI